ncbi:MAG: DUF692 family protein [Bacillota bacterium]|nr:DUF692 family protein [Bacillota bacterium]
MAWDTTWTVPSRWAGSLQAIRVFGPFFRPGACARRSPYLSVHLEYSAGAGEPFDERAFLTALTQDIEYLRELSGLPVHLENIHFYRPRPGQAFQPPRLCAPDFIREALDRTRSRLLLDLAHAMIAAWQLGEPAADYLGQLPLELVTEVHIAGPEMVNGELRDRHKEVSDEGFTLLEEVIHRGPVETVTLEYGGVGPLFAERNDPEALLRQLQRIKSILEAHRLGALPECGRSMV